MKTKLCDVSTPQKFTNSFIKPATFSNRPQPVYAVDKKDMAFVQIKRKSMSQRFVYRRTARPILYRVTGILLRIKSAPSWGRLRAVMRDRAILGLDPFTPNKPVVVDIRISRIYEWLLSH